MNRFLALVMLAGALLLGLLTIAFWDEIRRGVMDPGRGFQTVEPPAPPDYADPASWALLPAAGETAPAAADVFFIHPTTYQGREWNGPVDDAAARARLMQVMIPNYAGPFAGAGDVYAPLYRQASLYTQLTLRQDARDARAFAYGDVKRAFEWYLSARGDNRPLIIVGVEQGGLLAQRLALEFAADPRLKTRLAAVYLIETAVPAADHAEGSALPACAARDEAGCVVAYMAEADDEGRWTAVRLGKTPMWRGDRLTALEDTPLLCVNPLTGVVGDDAAADLNLGATDASGITWGEEPGLQPFQISARCEAGLLKASKPRSASLRGRSGWVESQRARPYNWFYADLAEDAKARLAALTRLGHPAPPVK